MFLAQAVEGAASGEETLVIISLAVLLYVPFAIVLIKGIVAYAEYKSADHPLADNDIRN